MRNDVKFGLTIGGLLVFILIIWVAVVNRGGKQATGNNDIAIVDNGKPADTSANSTPAAAPTPAVSNPTPQTQQPLVTTSTPTPDFGTTTATPEQNTSPASSDNSAGHDWTKLLNDGPGSTPLPAAVSNANETPNSTAANTPLVTAADTHVGPPDLTDATPLIGSPATRPTARTHVVAEGETFYTIAQAEYGNSKYYLRIIDANPGVNPNRLKIGQVLVIPDLSAGANSSQAIASNTPDDTGTTSIDPTRSYRVQSGDTLERIARKLYGRGQDWQKIYDLNKDQIGPNPGRLTLNMVLRLPEPPTVASAN